MNRWSIDGRRIGGASSRGRSNPFAAGPDIGQDLIDPILIDDPKALLGDAQTDPTLLLFDPEAMGMEIRQESPLGLVVGMRDVIAGQRSLTGYLADSRHDAPPILG
jgi:hypothetical protein